MASATPWVADAILLLHVAFVLFIVLGFVAIWLGAAWGKRWSTDPWLRGLHLAAIAIVVLESWLGLPCPLTVWEDALRGTHTNIGFVAHWLRALLFWNLPAWFFTALYTAVGALAVATWLRIPPRRRR